MQQFGVLGPELAATVQRMVVRDELPKKTFLLREGRVCNHLWLIEKGLARNYTEADGKFYTNDIVIDGELMTSFASFVSRQPAQENIELLEDSVLYSICYDDLQELYYNFPETERIGRLITESKFISLSSQTHRLRYLNSKERYQYLQEHKPEIVRRAPIGVIASYLGMTIETLSRIRGEGISGKEA